MPIEFSCSECERPIRVRDELAGKRIKCPGCSEAVTVPEEDAPPPPKKSGLRAAPAAPARRRAEDEEDDRPRRPARGRDDEDEDDRPRRPSRARDEDEDEGRPRKGRGRDDDEDEDDRPRKKPKKQGGSGMLMVLGIGGGVLGLLLIGGLLWWLLSGGGGAGSLAMFVPGDGQAFASIRVADLWKAAQVQQALAEINKQPGAKDPAAEMEKETGLKPSEIERLTVVAGDSEGRTGWGVVETLVPIDEAKIRGRMKNAQELTAEGRKYVKGDLENQRNFCVHFAGPRMMVVGPEEGVKKALATAAKRNKGDLDDGLALLSPSRHVVVGFTIPAKMMQDARQNLGGNPFAKPYLSLTEAQAGTVVMNLGQNLDLDTSIRFPDDPKAQSAKTALTQGLALAQLGLGALKLDKAASEALSKALDSIKIDAAGGRLTVKASADMGPAVMTNFLPMLGGLGGGLGGSSELQNNFKQILIAHHAFASANGNAFPTNISDPARRRPLLSWRVAILPYIEQEALYKRFRLNEPWNSPNNRPLVNQMPRIYARPGQPNTGRTSVLAFTGPGTAHDGTLFNAQGRGIPIVSITDGTSNTVAIVDSTLSVEWTKPEDIVLLPGGSAKAVLRQDGGNYLVGLFDGSIRRLKASISEQTLRSAITVAGAEVLGSDW